MKMSSAVVIDNRKVYEAKDYKITKRLNDVDVMVFSTANDKINRDRFAVEKDMFVEILGEWGVITRNEIVDNRLKVTWEQRAWHLTRKLYSGTSYNGNANTLIDNVVNSANTNIDDLPFNFKTEFFGEVDVNVRGNLRFNNHLEVIQSICTAGNFNVRFRGLNVEFGKFVSIKDISEDRSLVSRLNRDLDLKKFGNVFYIVGRDGTLKKTVDSSSDSEMKYKYDRVISSSKYNDANELARVFLEYDNVKPIIEFTVTIDEFVRYGFDVGDVLRVDIREADSSELGFYRIVKMVIGFSTVSLSFEFSNDGQFSSRTFDSSGVLQHLGKKIVELERFR